VGALEADWALPEKAGIVFGTPEDLLRRVRASAISMEEVEMVAVDGFGTLLPPAREALATLFETLSKEAQKILLTQPFSEEAEAFAKAHMGRAVHVPPRAAQPGEATPPPRRGEVAYRIAAGEKAKEVLRTVAAVLDGEARHVLLFFRSEEQAADLGDYLSLHGYVCGPPGDPMVPLWLAVEELPTRKILDDWSDPTSVTTLSVDVPPGPDSLDRRHGGQEPGVVILRSRELPHLRDVARRTGYRLVPARDPIPTRVASDLERLQTSIERALSEGDLGPYYLALEPLFERYAPGEVAAAALALLKSKRSSLKDEETARPVGKESEIKPGPPPRTWARLFVAVGEKDGVGPGDLLGAIAGETGVEGSQVGKIEIRETYSLVEVVPGVADTIIRKLNGTSIRGRAVRVDHDRGSPRSRGRDGSRGRPRPRGGPSGRD
jgi:ATP-dependent RNA helicase DeaD